jgi:SAM-dependent methyltransferase
MISRPPADQTPSAPGNPAWPKSPSAPSYSPKEYWEKLATSGGHGEAEALAAVLHPDAPEWFNRTIDRLQAKAWTRALGQCRLDGGAHVLDVGCGTGRWLKRLQDASMAPTGTDRTATMLGIARERLPGAALVTAEAEGLPFADASFDCVAAVTVLQHVGWDEQTQALREMARVVRPGGAVVLLDLIRGQGPHIFPRAPEDWIELGSRANVQIISWFGQEFLIFDRLLRGATIMLRGITGEDGHARLPLQATRGKRGAMRRLYWLGRRLAVLLSVWAEPVVERLCPQSLATHGVFIFQKPRQGA